MKALIYISVWLGVLMGMATGARAQEPVPPPAPAYQPLSDAQLEQLLGPIALYPDPLIAEILPASTFPTEIVMADRYVNGGGDPGQIDAQPWDPSVQALARYPVLLQWLDQNLDWTTELGQAFLYQQQGVMEAIQQLRQSAYNLGNLQSTPQEEVINDGGYIEIVPVDPDVMYVPLYQPDQVYYVAAGGVPFVTFGAACEIGPWLDNDFDWANHNIIVWNRAHPRPNNWWHQPARQRGAGPATVWHPRGGGDVVEVNRGDRGWGQSQSVVATTSRGPARQMIGPAIHAAGPSSVSAHQFQPQPAPQPEATGAFIGIQSSQDTRTYSNRGEQSMRTMSHSTPVTHSEPVSRTAEPSHGGGGGAGGGGGGGHGSRR